ncbi:MAG: phospholipid carrier-dependent glycosyltransferase [Anaerolineae bacterium]|uniref:phospholipid carrier-dependent glycosyltransferase n=1 Tax=Candidatus Amarolinea dominans TaxID=3140696 RepID=UPI0031365ADB|nr:phospholipid carrier-dependent glycosyltransferase [Anaerolineae bacterium]
MTLHPWLYRRHTAFVVGLLAVALLATVVLYRQALLTPFDGDETGWISSGVYYTDLLLARDFAWEKWQCRACGPWGGLNMPLGKWAIGAPLKLYYAATPGAAPFMRFYDFERSLAQNQAEGRVPPADVLRVARLACAAFGVLCCLLLFCLGFWWVNWATGLLAAVLLLATDGFVQQATRAMTDVHYLSFLLAGCLAAGLLVKRSGRRAHLTTSTLAGLCAGLACAVKVTGIAVGGLIFLALLAYVVALHRVSLRAALRYAALFVVVAVVTVYLLNPFFWPNWQQLNAMALLGETRSLLTAVVSGQLGSGQISQSYPQVGNLAHIAEFPQMFLRWRTFMQTQLPIGNWTEPRLLAIHRSLFVNLAAFPFEWVLLLIGAAAAGRRVIAAWRRAQTAPALAPLVFFAVNYLFVLFLVQLNWPRYYLPTAVAGKLLVAYGIVVVFEGLVGLVRRRPVPGSL